MILMYLLTLHIMYTSSKVYWTLQDYEHRKILILVLEVFHNKILVYLL